MTTKKTAGQATVQRLDTAIALLAKIEAELKADRESAVRGVTREGRTLNWAHAGDAEYAMQQLQELAEHMGVSL